MEMFLTALPCQEPAAFSGLSDEHKHLNTPSRKAPAYLDAYVRSSAALTAEGEKYTVRNIQFLRLTAQNRHLPRTPDGWDRAGKSPGAKRKGSGGQCASKWIKSGGRKVVCWIFEGDGNEFH